MNDLIHYQNEGPLALIGLARAPVNALGQALREQLLEACERAAADDSVKAIVLHGAGLPFSAGADISEFGSPASFARPDLPHLLTRLTELDKPLIAAIGGLAFGGGLELALACGYRVAQAGARLGLPEIKLGLLPGAGGTQRLPRLIGAAAALEIIASGQPINASRALALGLLDRVTDTTDSLLEAAKAFAAELISRQAPARPAWPHPNPGAALPTNYFVDHRAANQSRWKGQSAPQRVVAAIEAACHLPLVEGLAREGELFKEAEASSESEALRHVFFAEREVGKLPGLYADTPIRPIARVAVIGAGTMGGGIAMNFANAGMAVTLLELKAEGLERGLALIRKNYDSSVQRGKLSPEQMEQRLALIHGSLDYADITDVDLVIEAVFESLPVKQQVFRTLDEVCKEGAILASNTSTLDVDAIAAVTRRPQDVVGLHFFSPANVMRLLEVVRGTATAADVLATTLKIAKRIGKIPVVSGVCFGFIGNRMLEPYSREAHRLLLEGAAPAQIDKVLTGLGMAMGVIAMHDLAGIDVSFLVRESRRELIAHDPGYCKLADALYALGRFGQKTSRGYYVYEGRERKDDPEVVALAEQIAGELGIPRRVISDQEIHDRCLLMLINEGIQLLDEGIAQRSSDIDLVWINGYGFPAWRGGPMHYAEGLGLAQVFERIGHYRQALGAYGAMWFQPAALLERLVASGKSRIERI
ncbi:3-hydroxyacyl-CoA dehydrogenase NAD-binding domain-containing protein [Pseudomonas sp. P8_241]|uniref:3-hydroxyacyl-CoA dehydrogenase NAD-binding domain-containing protein n=1 Tax=Pseudomonas sp. P8_241 TaxID=3043445 RepID=UPI002A3709DE|nr:3-hydroxyacyl-CoA dehydrogenase NAD-binding domain-containing protein [Pseudomonas sp. P8_241]WPN45172.1 3-hydroxyacyl-CoA dehydrogenase NAD-binding domain-containing protein [Pseudomonas sp. P8_241]